MQHEDIQPCHVKEVFSLGTADKTDIYRAYVSFVDFATTEHANGY